MWVVSKFSINNEGDNEEKYIKKLKILWNEFEYNFSKENLFIVVLQGEEIKWNSFGNYIVQTPLNILMKILWYFNSNNILWK